MSGQSQEIKLRTTTSLPPWSGGVGTRLPNSLHIPLYVPVVLLSVMLLSSDISRMKGDAREVPAKMKITNRTVLVNIADHYDS